MMSHDSAIFDEMSLEERCARLVYQHNILQKDVAKLLGISQSYVSRLIRKAREDGILMITFRIPSHYRANFEREHKNYKKFKHVRVEFV